MSWKKSVPVPRDMLNEWVCICIIETHTRQWLLTLEEMGFLCLGIVARTQRIEARLKAAEACLQNSLTGMEHYSAVLDDNGEKTRQILTMMRERQFLIEKWTSSQINAVKTASS